MDTRRTNRGSLERRRRERRRRFVLRWLVLLGCVAIVVLAVFIALRGCGSDATGADGQNGTSTSTSKVTGSTDGASGTVSTGGGSDTSSPDTTVAVSVVATAKTSPKEFSITTGIFKGTTGIESFKRQNTISFGSGKDYTSLQGIVTFRGNNYREGASYGTADVALEQLEPIWSVSTGSLAKSSGTGAWTGSGWTGQPLIVKWPEDLKDIMNLKPEKKTDSELTEVIYPCLDGNIYFLDLKDGTYTRPSIKSGGGPFKGTASLYPDGTPILFVGHGENSPGKDLVRARLYSLIDQKLLYTFGKKTDPNALRKFHAYDSSALFDVESDTIIEPGENGLLYTIRLNTQFDKAAGTLSVKPGQPIKLRYTAPSYREAGDNSPNARWWGMEDSAVIWRNYAYIADNGGKLMCFDLNTMKLVWVQNVLDDTNTTPVFEESPEDNTGYIYISTSLHITATGSGTRKGGIPIWKINAATGEIVWETPPYECYTISGVSGGVQATPVLGKNDISNLVIYPIARTPNVGSGILVALDRGTGKEVWRTSLANYSWSSPVAVYTPQGKSYIVQCDSVGNMFLIEGKTGKVLSSINLGTNIEASPAAFGDTIVVGTRGQKIFGVGIK